MTVRRTDEREMRGAVRLGCSTEVVSTLRAWVPTRDAWLEFGP